MAPEADSTSSLARRVIALSFVPVAAVVVLPLTSLHQSIILRAVLLVPIGLLALSAPRRLWASVVNGPIGLLVVVAALSILWSENRQQSVLGVGALVLETLAALAAVGVAGKHASRYLATTLQALLVASMLAAVFTPGFGRMVDVAGHPWRGIFVHKNSLGMVAAFAVVIFAGVPAFRRRTAWVGFAFLVLWMTQSRGALLSALAGLAVMQMARLFYLRLDRHQALTTSMFYLLLAGGGYALWRLLDLVAGLLGREQTLTGRTAIWSLIVDYGAANIWFGSGVSAQIYSGSELANSIFLLRNQPLGTTHNGYLALYLALGVVGVVLLALVILQVLARVESGRRQGTLGVPVVLCLGTTVCYLAVNLTEDRLLTRSGWFFLLFGVLQLVAAQLRAEQPTDNPEDPRRLEDGASHAGGDPDR